MLKDFSGQYAELSDEELLQIASERTSLTDEAVAALNAELSQRKLTHDDITEHERFVKQGLQREAKKVRRKLFGTRRSRDSWVDGIATAFWSFVAFALIASTYAALPQRYHFSPDWQQAAENVLFASVFLAVASGSWGKRIAFWMSLLISSTLHAILLHTWIVRGGTVSGRQTGKLAVLLGIVLFFVVYGCGYALRRKFYGEEA